MRITGGIYRGRALESPKSSQTHPMGDRERLALFNSLTPYLAGATVLDAYAGTGALGLEALSRGAESATFIEQHAPAIRTLRQNLKTIASTAQTTVLPVAVAKATLPPQSFDLILADPPYTQLTANAASATQAANITSDLVRLARALKPGGHFVLSHPAEFNHKDFEESSNLQLIKTKKYAAAHLSTFTTKSLQN